MSGVGDHLPELPEDSEETGTLDTAPISDSLIPMFVQEITTALVLLKKQAPAKV